MKNSSLFAIVSVLTYCVTCVMYATDQGPVTVRIFLGGVSIILFALLAVMEVIREAVREFKK